MGTAPPDCLDECSDAQLVRLLVSGNDDGMTVIFHRHYRLVMSIALRILHDTGEAKELAQIVFSEFHQKASLFDETKGKLGTWLLRAHFTLHREDESKFPPTTIPLHLVERR
jgi:hypothetical protein